MVSPSESFPSTDSGSLRRLIDDNRCLARTHRWAWHVSSKAKPFVTHVDNSLVAKANSVRDSGRFVLSSQAACSFCPLTVSSEHLTARSIG